MLTDDCETLMLALLYALMMMMINTTTENDVIGVKRKYGKLWSAWTDYEKKRIGALKASKKMEYLKAKMTK